MSQDRLKLLTEALKSDSALRSQIRAAKSPEEVVTIAVEHGYSITVEDLKGIPEFSGELSEAQLEGASGGRRRMDFTGVHIVDIKFSDLDTKEPKPK